MLPRAHHQHPSTELILRAIPFPASPNQVWLWIHPSLSLLQEGRCNSCQALCQKYSF